MGRIINGILDRRLAQYQNALMEKHIAEVQNIYKEMRGWKHDYHSHMQTMKAYLFLGETDKLGAYIDQLDGDLTAVDTVVKTGNVMADAILNSKLSLAKSRGIAVNAKAAVPESLPFSDVDLCVILGNLLDNAIEAAEKAENPFLRVYIGVKRTQLYIVVTNSALGKAKRVGGRFATTKAGYHGFGIARVDRLCEKYKGYATRAGEEGAFTSEILLPL